MRYDNLFQCGGDMSSQESVSNGRPEHHVYTVDAFEDGLALGQHPVLSYREAFEQFFLRLPGEQKPVRLHSRYSIQRTNHVQELQKLLKRLSYRGTLRQTLIILGVNNDPLHPFEGRFDATMKFLSLFEKYTPGLLCIQTRSPLLVLALPVLKRLGRHCIVNFGIETPLEEVARRYTPGLPRIEERLKAIRSLSRFDIPVRAQVSPILPYGDWHKDAAEFAQCLVEHTCGVALRSLSDGSAEREQELRKISVATKLSQDRKFHWLRPDAATPLREALQRLAPEILTPPSFETLRDPQLKIFAA